MKISYSRPAATPALPAHPDPTAAPDTRPTAPPPAEPGPPAALSSQPDAPAAPGALTDDEQHMIDRYFPEQPKLTMRLYGPSGRSTQVEPPTAVGGHLDLTA